MRIFIYLFGLFICFSLLFRANISSLSLDYHLYFLHVGIHVNFVNMKLCLPFLCFFILFYFIFSTTFIPMNQPARQCSFRSSYIFPSIFLLTTPFFFLSICHSFFLTLFCPIFLSSLHYFPSFPPSLFLSFSRPF